MLEQETLILLVSASSIGVLHTLFGPDHYIPFIVLASARKWSVWQTMIITLLCGIGHVGSSIIIGIIGILLGITLEDILSIESSRGSLAAWMLIAFGLLYFLWGLRKAINQKKHSHLHQHEDGTVHCHNHSHQSNHLHIHKSKTFKELTPWILFTIFVFGPCEPFIPLFLYPASKNNLSDLILVTFSFTSATILTMILIVAGSLWGFKFIPVLKLDRYMHSIAGGTIMICGFCIKFLGL